MVNFNGNLRRRQGLTIISGTSSTSNSSMMMPMLRRRQSVATPSAAATGMKNPRTVQRRLVVTTTIAMVLLLRSQQVQAFQAISGPSSSSRFVSSRTNVLRHHHAQQFTASRLYQSSWTTSNSNDPDVATAVPRTSSNVVEAGEDESVLLLEDYVVEVMQQEQQQQQVQATILTSSAPSAKQESPADASSLFANASLQTKLRQLTGTIDADRYLFPDYAAGRVERLSSSLRDGPDQTSGNLRLAQAALLVAATTLASGAGLVGGAENPIGTAGLLPSTLATVAAFGYMNVAGLLTAELTLNRLGRTGGRGVESETTMLDLFTSTDGGAASASSTNTGKSNNWKVVTSQISYLGWHSLMLVACLAGLMGSSLDATTLPLLGGTAAALTGAAVAGSNDNRKTKTTSANLISNGVNLALTAALTALVGATVATASAVPSWTEALPQLLDSANQHPEFTVHLFPTLCLAFGFPTVVPTVVRQLHGDRKRIRAAILMGTSLPLALLGAWNVVTAVAAGDASGVDPTLVAAVTALTLGASTVRYSHGLVQGWKHVVRQQQEQGNSKKATESLTTSTSDNNSSSNNRWRQLLPPLAAVVVPPLVAASQLWLQHQTPDHTYESLSGLAGAFGVSTLCLLLVPLATWKERYGSERAPLTAKPLVPAGKLPLGSLYKAAATLIVEQGAEKLGILDALQHFWT